MASIQSMFLSMVLRLLRFNRRLEKMIDQDVFESPNVKPDRYMKKTCLIETCQFNENDTYILRPKASPSKSWILFLHGGAFVQGFDTFHWRFMNQLIQRTGCTFVAPDYPLLPQATSEDMYDMIKTVYQNLIQKVDRNHIILMGDSAGGGLALGFAQWLKAQGIDYPHDIILLSPWLDITMQIDNIENIESNDPILKRRSLKRIGNMLAKGNDPKHYLLSPLYGNLQGLGTISMFAGTHDILVSDARALYKKAENQGIHIHYHEYPKMLHDWMMLGLPESQWVIEKISEQLMR